MMRVLKHMATLVTLYAVGIGAVVPALAGPHPIAGGTKTVHPVATRTAPAATINSGPMRPFSGELKVLSVSGTTINTMSFDGQARTVSVTPQTSFTLDAQPASLADVRPGVFLNLFSPIITAAPSADNILIVLPRVTGVVAVMGGSVLSVTGADAAPHTIILDSTTVIERAGRTVGLDAIQPGVAVDAVGYPNQDGSLKARQLTITLPHLSGAVLSSAAADLTISGPYGAVLTIATTADTLIVYAGGPSPSSVPIGAWIDAEGSLSADGLSMVAARITVQPKTWNPCGGPVPLGVQSVGTSSSSAPVCCIAVDPMPGGCPVPVPPYPTPAPGCPPQTPPVPADPCPPPPGTCLPANGAVCPPPIPSSPTPGPSCPPQPPVPVDGGCPTPPPVTCQSSSSGAGNAAGSATPVPPTGGGQGSLPPCAPQPPTPGGVQLITQDDNGRVIQIRAGDQIDVALSSAATLTWQVKVDDPSILVPRTDLPLPAGVQAVFTARTGGQTLLSATGTPRCDAPGTACLMLAAVFKAVIVVQ